MTLNNLPSLRWALPSFMSVLLCACGGGGNESGPYGEIQPSPTSITVIGGSGCPAGVGPTVHVYGGTPPYSLKNSLPTGMTLDTTKLINSGDGFTLTFINDQCMSGMPITIEDTMGLVVEVPVTYQPKQ